MDEECERLEADADLAWELRPEAPKQFSTMNGENEEEKKKEEKRKEEEKENKPP